VLFLNAFLIDRLALVLPHNWCLIKKKYADLLTFLSNRLLNFFYFTPHIQLIIIIYYILVLFVRILSLHEARINHLLFHDQKKLYLLTIYQGILGSISGEGI